jgi:DNA repair exonuclease SbcCD ATPase subunit
MQKTIKRLILRNFTSYESAEIEFSDGVTIIRGNNGHGKSNILLALQIILFADDFPDTLIRWGQKEAYIQVDFTDGSSISRTRSGKSQKIVLTDNHGADTVLTNVKTSAEMVREFTGFTPVKLDENGSPELLQYLTMDDPHFLLNRSAEVTLRMLSALISGQGIETAKMSLSKAEKGIQTEVNAKAKAFEVASANVSALTSNEVERHRTQARELLDSRVSAFETKHELVESYKEAQAVLARVLNKEELKEIASAKKDYAKLVERNEKLTEKRDYLQELLDAKDAHAIATKRIRDLTATKKTLVESLAATQAEIDSMYQKCKTCGKMTICEECNG